MKKVRRIPELRNLHLILRCLAIAFVLWEIFSGKAFWGRHPVPVAIPVGIVIFYAVVTSGVLLFFLPFPFAEPVLIFCDFLVGTILLVLYKAQWSFVLLYFFATYSSAFISWNVAFLCSLAGTVLFFLQRLFFVPKPGVLFYTQWFFVLTVNVLIATLSLLRWELAQEKKKRITAVSLIEAGQELGATLTYQQLYKLLHETVKGLFSASTCVVYLKGSEGLMKVNFVESPDPNFHDFDPKLVKTALNLVIQERSPQIFEDIQALPAALEQVLPKVKFIRGGMAVPFIFENEVFGVVFIATKLPYRYDEEALRIFTVLVKQTAITFRNIMLHEKTAVLAITDSVSGLYTHGHMQDILEQEFRKSKYSNLLLSTIILDVDHFKIINDQFGHPEGDSILRELGILIKSLSRSTDTVCRYGGDEFMIILPQTNRIGAVLAAERIRQAVEEHEFVAGSKVARITISGGVANFPEDAQTKKELIEVTDQALYQAKNQGRNKVCFNPK